MKWCEEGYIPRIMKKRKGRKTHQAYNCPPTVNTNRLFFAADICEHVSPNEITGMILYQKSTRDACEYQIHRQYDNSARQITTSDEHNSQTPKTQRHENTKTQSKKHSLPSSQRPHQHTPIHQPRRTKRTSSHKRNNRRRYVV